MQSPPASQAELNSQVSESLANQSELRIVNCELQSMLYGLYVVLRFLAQFSGAHHALICSCGFCGWRRKQEVVGWKYPWVEGGEEEGGRGGEGQGKPSANPQHLQ